MAMKYKNVSCENNNNNNNNNNDNNNNNNNNSNKLNSGIQKILYCITVKNQ